MPCNTAMRPAESASTGWKQYDVLPTLWDVYRGRKMLNIEQFVGGSLDVWATMTNELVQSKWAPSTRALYQGWLEAFLFFCKWKAVAPLPINPEIFSNWITRIAVSYCFSTMQIAVSAIIGFCTLNNFENPIKQHPLCSAALAGAKRARCGAYNADRKALDAQFIIAMWRIVAEMRAQNRLTIKWLRARCFVQLAFEAALRGGEICNLKVCDVAFIECGEACGRNCATHHHKSSDALVFC